MNVLSLFAGIGGLELGLEHVGMAVAGRVEIDPVLPIRARNPLAGGPSP